MADGKIDISEGSGQAIDTRTESTNSNHRQVIVVGDPSTNAGVAPVDGTAGLKVNLGADNDVTLATLPDTAAGDLAAINSAVSGTLTVDNSGNTQPVSNAGLTELAAAINASSQVDINIAAQASDVTIADGGNSITVDGTVTANAGTGTFTVQEASALDVSAATVTVDTEMPAAAALQDGAANPTIPAVGAMTHVYNGTNWDRLRGDTSGLDISDISAGTQTNDVKVTLDGESVTANAGTGTFTIQEASALDVSAATVTVSGTVTANLGAVDNAVLDSIDTSNSAIQTAVETLDNAISGSEMQVDVVASLPSGNNNIGNVDLASSIPAGTNNIGDVDVATQPARDNATDTITASLDTNAIMNDTTALTPKFAVIDEASSGDNTLVAAVSGKKIRVLSYTIVAAGDVTVRFEDGAGGTALTGQMSLTTNSGASVAFSPVGHFETSANTLLNLELSAAVSVDGHLCYVEV